MLGVTLLVAFRFMRDLGFTPQRDVGPVTAVRNVIRGRRRRRLPQPAGPLAHARGAVHASGRASTSSTPSQPYLLELYGDKTAYGIAGLAAAIVAGAQIVGGLLVSRIRRLFSRRTTALLLGACSTSCCSCCSG